MKKIFIALAAVAAMVGCSKESNTQGGGTQNESIAVNASIDVENTRVTVEGEKFTDVKWEQNDKVMLASVAGASAELYATASGDSVRFEGEGMLVAEVDTYYAIYPATTITGGVATIDLAEQAGDDAAVLVAKAGDVAKGSIDMTFKPANALLHVAVSGVESLAKAEFKAFDGSAIASTFTYNFADESASATGETMAYTINNPLADGFFFALPADMAMDNGYIVTLTDAAGNVCSKAYNGKTFAKGTTTRVNIEWATPSVTLGAKTSYSYYMAGDSASANKCANTDIYFVTGVNGESCASSYKNVQDAMISDVGYEVDGVTYLYSAGEVSWDKASNTFCMNSQPSYSTSWGEKSSIKAFVVVDGIKYYSANNIHITGLPYNYNFVNGSLDAYRNAGWTTNGQLRVGNESLVGRAETLVLNHRRYSKFVVVLFDEHEKGFVVSPKFDLPNAVMVQPAIAHSTYNAGGNLQRTTYVGPVSNTSTSNTSSVSFKTSAGSSTSGTVQGKNEWQNAFEISASVPYISVDCNDITGSYLGTYYFLHEVAFRYAE